MIRQAATFPSLPAHVGLMPPSVVQRPAPPHGKRRCHYRAAAAVTAMTFFVGRRGLVLRSTSRTLALHSSRSAAREQQVLRLREPESGSEVVLVACMHFNPRSVALAADTARQLADSGQLGAVVVESCPTRWEKANNMHPAGSPLRILLDNEMQAASDVAEASGKPVVLGDQRVEEVGAEVAAAAKEALADLATPLNGGWARTGSEIVQGFRLLSNNRVGKNKGEPDNSSIGPLDFMDLGLMLGIPVSLVRYCLSTLLKAPAVFAAVVAFLVFFSYLPESPISDLISFVCEVLSLRVLLSVLLRDRDIILAKSIAATCKASGGPGRAVVAILGAAHCNGVKRHLLEVSST